MTDASVCKAFDPPRDGVNHSAEEIPPAWLASAFPGLPQPLGQCPQPEFPIEVLPKIGRDIVAAVAKSTATPPDFAANVFTGVLSLAMAKKVRVRVYDRLEDVNLYIIVGAASGERKSAVFKQMTKPVDDFQAEERARLRLELAKQRGRQETLEHELSEARKQAAKALAGRNEEDQKHWESKAEALALDLAQVPQPVEPLFICDNVTTEELCSLISIHGRMGVFSAEGGEIFQIMAGRYNDSPNFGIYLAASNGDRVTIHRRGREEILSDPILTVVLCVQPMVVREVVQLPAFKGRGLIGRLNFALPKSLVGSRRFHDGSVLPELREEYDAYVRELMQQHSSMSNGEVELELSEEAYEELEAFHDFIEPKLTGELVYMADWGNRATGRAVSLAGLLHRSEEPGRVISGESMRRGVRLMRDYYLPHAQRAHAMVSTAVSLGEAKYLLTVIGNNEWGSFATRQLHQKVRGRRAFEKVEAVKTVLPILETSGHIKQVPGKGTLWVVNPKWDRKIEEDEE